MKDYTGQYYLSFFVQPWLLDPVDKVTFSSSNFSTFNENIY